MSMSAVVTFLGSLNLSLGTEAGRSLWESAGVLARRCAGHPVPAPVGEAGREDVARVLSEGARRDPAQARALSALMRGTPAPGGAHGVPRLLPASSPFFKDRQEALKILDRELARPGEGRPRVVNIHGPAGIGSSTLAVHWGWREVGQFPDGQVYLDLNGASASAALPVGTVLHRILTQLGVDKDAIPPGVEDRTGLYRTSVAERRLLVVLDHVHSAAQIRPLITSASGVVVVAVSRHALVGLDAIRVPVGPLPEQDAVHLLGDLVGKQALAAARATLPSVLERCAGSPWALRACAPALLQPTGQATAPDESATDPLHAIVDLVYAGLPPHLAVAVRSLALRPWPALTVTVAAAALDTAPEQAAAVLAQLAERQLLQGAGTDRYVMRPLVRQFAQDAALREGTPAQRAAVVDRTVAELVRFAIEADLVALDRRWHLGPRYDEPDQAGQAPRPTAYTGPGEALAALEAELGNLLEAVHTAEGRDDAETVFYLCQAMWPVQLKAGHVEEIVPALRTGARLADRAFPGTDMAGRAHTQLGLALKDLRRDQEALEQLEAAAAADRLAGHLRGQATAVESLGLLRLGQWDHEAALPLFQEAGRILEAIRPGERGFEDVPRARALLERHQGRALRGLERLDEARERLLVALRFFRGTAEAYNTARTLTDLAAVLLDAGDAEAARPMAQEALALLEAEHALAHLEYVRALLERCVNEAR
jgi:tetratricopeptide (TPR) repeat protein